jgi:hypothetical protein
MPRQFAYQRLFSLFGVSVWVTSESLRALDAFEACGLFNSQACFSDGDDLSVYVVLRSYAVNELHERRHDHVDANSLALNFDGILICADARTGHGTCLIPQGQIAGDALAEAMRTIVLFLVAQAGRTPIHASAFMLGGTAIVLSGPSGSGKSTLVLAAARSGLDVLAEDTIFVQEHPKLRLWSNADAIHVFARDAPEGDGHAMRFRAGRWKAAIPLSAKRDFAGDAVLCVLAHGAGLSLSTIGTDEAIRAVAANPEPGYEFYGERSMRVARHLAGDQAWRLTLSNSPDEAIDLIRRTLGAV